MTDNSRHSRITILSAPTPHLLNPKKTRLVDWNKDIYPPPRIDNSLAEASAATLYTKSVRHLRRIVSIWGREGERERERERENSPLPNRSKLRGGRERSVGGAGGRSSRRRRSLAGIGISEVCGIVSISAREREKRRGRL